MSLTPINIGAVANDGTGDPLRDAFDIVNQNFSELDSRYLSGYSGSSGASGLSGSSGISGYSGVSGYSGSGISGWSGYSGAGTSGWSGYSGASTSGWSGYSGISGYSGRSGYSGYSGSGVSGYSGYSGAGTSGWSGYSGTSTSGYSGYSGNSTSGYSGYSGVSGFSGRSGYSGYSGISGYSGVSGYSGAGITILDDVLTNATYYPAISTITTGTLSTLKTSSTKFQFNPSTGNLLIAGSMLPSANVTYNLGSAPNNWWNSIYGNTIYAGIFYGTATNALYADLAERYHSDESYPVGTVMKIGGEFEITAVREVASDDVWGVISHEPAFLMNSEAGSNDTHPPIALTGKIPVRVIGPVAKGDAMISAGEGLARAALTPLEKSVSFGRCLENSNDLEERLVMVSIK